MATNRNIFKREGSEAIERRQDALGPQKSISSAEWKSMSREEQLGHLADEKYFNGNTTPEQNAVHFANSDALETARIPKDAIVEGGVVIQPNVTIGRRTHVGEDVKLGAGVMIGSDVHIPAGTNIGAGATVPNRTWVESGAHVPFNSVAEDYRPQRTSSSSEAA